MAQPFVTLPLQMPGGWGSPPGPSPVQGLSVEKSHLCAPPGTCKSAGIQGLNRYLPYLSRPDLTWKEGKEAWPLKLYRQERYALQPKLVHL